jgi:hypothetical protein
MTDATPGQPSEANKSHRHGGPFRLAAAVGILAGIVFIVAVIFWTGFVLGACEGGGGGHHGGGGGQWHHYGMAHHAVVIEQTVPAGLEISAGS